MRQPIHASSASRSTRATLTVPLEALPDVKDIVIQDDTPVDNIYVEKQQRLLTEPLYSSWRGPGRGKPFLALANVGLFFTPTEPPLVPDVMLAVDVRQEGDPIHKENNTYFVWTRGKVPDLIIEIVSDRRGGEQTHKMRKYAKWGVPCYVIFDYREVLRQGVLRAFGLNRRKYEPTDASFFEEVGLGLILWQGAYEEWTTRWLRWCDAKGRPIATGNERAKQERQRSKQERRHIERLQAQLRAAGIEPES